MKPVIAAVVTFNRLELTKQCLGSLIETVPEELWDLYIVDNASKDGTQDFLTDFSSKHLHVYTILNKANLGTANAINQVWKLRQPGQHAIKADNDVVIHDSGWLEAMMDCFRLVPMLGLIGLKRKDLGERPAHPFEITQPEHPWYRSALFELSNGWLIEVANHIMGTMTLYRNEAVDKLGYLYQPSGTYGLDDSLACLRLNVAGYEVAFLRGIEIDHIDLGEGGDEWLAKYTRWKRRHAGEWLRKYREICEEYKTGERPLYYDGSYIPQPGDLPEF